LLAHEHKEAKMAGSIQPELMSVQNLFANSLFVVPEYQRAYAWEQDEWDDLWGDIREGMRTRTQHFLGTIVLMDQETSCRDSEGRSLRLFHVVDGQQRLTTLCLLLLAVYDAIRQADDRISRGLWRDFVQHEAGMRKLCLGRLNREYFDQLVVALQRRQPLPASERLTNVRLREAVGRLRDHIEGWREVEGEGAQVADLATYARDNLQVLRFVTDSRPLAIKMFQTVNDRGKELSLLDKTKSFLMFYVTRYLQDDTELFESIEKSFGEVFDNYDRSKDLAMRFSISYLMQPQFRFNEDEFLRYAYHYGYNELRSRFGVQGGYEYGITPERIFDEFVKKACHELRDHPQNLRGFIAGWCADIEAVSGALVQLLRQITDSEAYKRLFQFQGPNASVYPLLVAAQARGILDAELLGAISVLDLRVYQVRGSDPKAELYRNAVAIMKTGDRDLILQSIRRYCREFGSNLELDGILRGHVYKQGFTKYVLWSFAVSRERDNNELDYGLYADCEIEHILPQDPSEFDVTTFGFDNLEDYESRKDGFGNLTPLEKSLNRRARHKPVGGKAADYADSRLGVNRVLGTRIGEGGFRREEQSERADAIVQFFNDRWPVP
jgi:hypothetical protein